MADLDLLRAWQSQDSLFCMVVGFPQSAPSKSKEFGYMRQVLGAGARGRPRGMGWGGRWERGSGWGTHVNPWLIHVSVWQNHYNIVKY